MKAAEQPWTIAPIHAEHTRSLSFGAVLNTRANPPPVDQQPQRDWRAFLDALSDEQKLRVRAGDVGGDEIMQWYAERGQHEQDRDEDTPDGPREQPEE